MAQQSRQSPMAVAMRPYGSFAGKESAVPAVDAATVIRRAPSSADVRVRRAPSPGSGGIAWGSIAEDVFDALAEDEWSAIPEDNPHAVTTRIRRAPPQETVPLRRV